MSLASFTFTIVSICVGLFLFGLTCLLIYKLGKPLYDEFIKGKKQPTKETKQWSEKDITVIDKDGKEDKERKQIIEQEITTIIKKPKIIIKELEPEIIRIKQPRYKYKPKEEIIQKQPEKDVSYEELTKGLPD